MAPANPQDSTAKRDDYVAALTTWFYAASADGNFPAVTYKAGRKLLSRASVRDTGPVSADWRDSNGGLTLVGIGLVLQMGHPAYIDRCCVSYHWLEETAPRVTPATLDYDTLALRVAVDANARLRNLRRLASFLSLAPGRPLVEDMHLLMQEHRVRFNPVWLDYLIKGRQNYPLWDLRDGTLLAPHTPLSLEDAGGWSRRRRHHRARPTR